jgi:hypothetical protein
LVRCAVFGFYFFAWSNRLFDVSHFEVFYKTRGEK